MTRTAEETPRRPLLREADRLLFPLGVLLAVSGVLPWIFFALGLTHAYRPIFHSVVFRSMFHPLAEIEGFLSCFAVGLLFTDLPRGTATAPPAAWQIVVAAGAPLAIVICAALQNWVLGQIAWLLLIGTVAEFSLRRLRSQTGRHSLTPGALWIGVALVMGAAGAVLAALADGAGDERFWLHELGRSLLTQGLFTGLVLGTAELFLCAGERVPLAAPGRRKAFAIHAFGIALFFASFWVGQLASFRLGYALRAAVTLPVVLSLKRPSLPPEASEMKGRLARIAIWMLPLGNAWVALAPTTRRAGMHVIYIGCFATLVLLFSIYGASWAPDRQTRPREVSFWQLGLGAACLAVALGARILVEFDPASFTLWLGIACASFVGALLVAFHGFTQRLAASSHNGRAQDATIQAPITRCPH